MIDIESINREVKYYHGTSNIFNLKIGNKILPPTESDNKREYFREYNEDVVYVTTSVISAEKYAKKAAFTFGGSPVVYEVEPDKYSLSRRINNEYICDCATIIRKV